MRWADVAGIETGGNEPESPLSIQRLHLFFTTALGVIMADVATRTPDSEVGTAVEPVRPRRFTREEYFRMAETGVLGPEDRTELIDGHLVEMTAQNAPHRAAVGKVDSQFQQILQGRNYWVQTQATLPLDCRNVPEPDIAILSGAPDDLLDGEPDEIPLIIEVADTTLTYDRTEKLVCYASNDIPEYWIANLQSRTLECYHDPAGDEYRERRTLERGETVTPRFDDTLELAVADLLPTPPAEGWRGEVSVLAYAILAARIARFGRARAEEAQRTGRGDSSAETGKEWGLNRRTPR